MKRFVSTYRYDIAIIVALFSLPLLLYWDVTFGGRTMLPIDNLYQWQPWSVYAEASSAAVPQNSLLSDLIIENYVWKRFSIQSLRSGNIPLWNPYIFAGQPFLANGQHSMYYPFSWLFFVMPVHAAFGWFTLIQLWIAGISGYVFGRILSLRRASSTIVGLVYQGSGFLLVSSAIFPMILAAVVWLPFLLGCIEKIIRSQRNKGDGKTLPWIVGGSVALGLVALAGHPEMLLYTLLIMGLYAAWRLIHYPLGGTKNWLRQLVKPAVYLFSLVILGLLLGAIQLVPQFELAQTNFREGETTLAIVRGWAFPLRRVLTFVLPNFFGNPAHHAYTDALTGETVQFGLNLWGNLNPHGAYSSNWGIKNYVEGGMYLGILPLILALFGTVGSWVQAVGSTQRVKGSGRQAARGTLASFILHPASFFLFLTFFALNFIFGSPLYAILYYGLPFIDQLHSPFRWVFALSIAVAALAGYGAEAILERRLPWLTRLVAYGLFITGILALVGLLVSRLLFGRIEPIIDRVFQAIAQAPDAFASGRAFYSYLFPQIATLAVLLLLCGVLLLLFRRSLSASSPPLLFAATLILLVADFFLANRGFHVATDPALLDFKPQMVEWLEQQEGHWRITSFAPKDKAFNANSGWLYNIEDVRGYDSIINKQYTNYMGAIEEQGELPFNRVQPIKDINALNSPLLDLLNVRYIISSEQLDDLPKLDRVWEGEGVQIYENLAALPRAYTVPHRAAYRTDDVLAAISRIDPRTQLLLEADSEPDQILAPTAPTAATLTSYGNVEVWIDAQVGEASWLVLNDSYADGWRAFARPIGGDDNSEIELPIERANGNFRAVSLEEGAWTVRFRYSPRSFILGGLASLMGGVIIILVLGVWGWRRVYRQEGELTNTQSIAKNSVVPMALNLFNKGIDFAFAMFYLRILGPGESGKYAAAISIALWFDIVANWGLDALIIRNVSQEKEKVSSYLLNTTVLRVVTMLIAIVPIAIYLGLGFVANDPLPRDVILALGLLMIGMVFSGVAKSLTGVFYVFESAEYPAALAAVTTILKVALGVTVLLLGWGFIGLAGVSIATNIVTLILLGVLAFRLFPLNGPWTFDRKIQREAWRVGYPLMINHLLATVFFKIDQTLLIQFDTEEAVGWYNSAYKWVDGFNVIPSFFTFALFPIIARQVKSSVDDARRTFRMAVKLLVLVALPLAAFITLLADLMIGVVGGEAFLPHGSISLRLVIWSIPIGWINSVTNYMIVSLGLEKRLTRGFIVGVLFNTIGNLIFIPMFSYVAAAVTTILSELILLIMFNHYLRQRMPEVQWFNLLWRPVTITVVMVGLMLLGAQVHLALGLLVGLVVYPLGLWGLNVFGNEERVIIRQILPESLTSRLGIRSEY